MTTGSTPRGEVNYLSKLRPCDGTLYFWLFPGNQKKIVKINKSPNSHYWLTAADELWGLDQLSSIFHLNAKRDLKPEMPSDIMMSLAGLFP